MVPDKNSQIWEKLKSQHDLSDALDLLNLEYRLVSSMIWFGWNATKNSLSSASLLLNFMYNDVMILALLNLDRVDR